MSNSLLPLKKAMDAIWDTDIDGVTKAIAVAVASLASKDNAIYAKVSSIAARSGFSVRKVQTVMGLMRASGLIEETGNVASGAKLYRLHPDRVEVFATECRVQEWPKSDA